jgi:hypothetical protein
MTANVPTLGEGGFCALACVSESHFAKHLLPAVNFNDLKTEI